MGTLEDKHRTSVGAVEFLQQVLEGPWKRTSTPGRRGCFYARSEVCKGGGWLVADEEGNRKGQWRRGIHMCTHETQNVRDGRGGQREEQGVSGERKE